jgi:transcriptional regulator with XRE-family HTH domain
MSREKNISNNTYEKPPFIEIGNRIREFAEEKHGGLANLAKKMNMSLQTLSQYVSGRNAPGKKQLLRLIELGCDANWLLTGKRFINSEAGFNSYVFEGVQLFTGLSEIEKLKKENEALKEIIDGLEKERKKILKLLDRKTEMGMNQ